MLKWTITYHIITQESAENGDYADSGIITAGNWHVPIETYLKAREDTPAEDQQAFEDQHRFSSLADALHYVHPVEDSGTWFSEVDPNTNYRTGEDEYRSLHPPKGITKASYNRVKRVLGVR